MTLRLISCLDLGVHRSPAVKISSSKSAKDLPMSLTVSACSKSRQSVNKPNSEFQTANQKVKAAKTERALRNAWAKCTESEETEKFLQNLLSVGVGVPSDEEFLGSEAGRRKCGLDKKNRKEMLVILTKGKLKDCQ